ncbi:MAG: hypothetical protein IJ962_03450 [Clostridia bacterium]|nr:hypothetical protein [Clostridia bacterium]
MICKKCANEYDDNLDVCPVCQTENKKKNFRVTIDNEKLNSESAETEKKQTRKDKQQEKAKEKLRSMGKKEKGASRFIVSSVCIMAVLMAALSCLSIFTDVFNEDDTVKTMALSSLSPVDAGELEDYLSKLYVLTGFELDDDTASDEFYVNIMPENEKGLYRAFGNSAKLVNDTADPAERFRNEEDNYSYYKLPVPKVDGIIESFGLVPNHTLNLKNAYCYKDYYYFEGAPEGSLPDVQADVVSSKRIQDGSYYVDCVFYNNEKQEGKIYAIAKKDEANEGKWIISRISSEPIFDNSGIMTENDGVFRYEMRRELFEGKLSGGTVFCEYSIEYPYFKGNSMGEKAVNLLYSEVVSKYKKSAEDADKHFEDYKGEKDELPIVVHISSEVTYSDEKYISTIVDISEYSPEKKQEGSILSERNIEGYIFDAETGEYLSKDEVLGKNYQLIYDLLYRIQGDYEYADLLDESINRPSDIPANNTIGKEIYECGSAITRNGYVFCKVTDEGFVKSVLLPNEVIASIKE